MKKLTFRPTEDIINFVHDLIMDHFIRPQNYHEDPTTLEGEVLSLIKIRLFSENNYVNLASLWSQYAHLKNGFYGSGFVSTYLIKKGLMDDDWSNLIKLMSDFYLELVDGKIK